MAGNLFEQLKTKYQPVLNLMSTLNVQLQNVNLEGSKIFIRATAPSLEIKNKIWDQVKLVDPTYSDLIADIQAPTAAAAVALGGATSSRRTYVVKLGDSLSKISQEFYGNSNQYMKIFEANKDKVADPDKIRAGMELVIP